MLKTQKIFKIMLIPVSFSVLLGISFANSDIIVTLKNNFKPIHFTVKYKALNSCGQKAIIHAKKYLNRSGLFTQSNKNPDYTLYTKCTPIKKAIKVHVTIKDSAGKEYDYRDIKTHRSYIDSGAYVADSLYKFATGYDGYFSEKIIYVKKTAGYGGRLMASKHNFQRSVSLTKGKDYLLQPFIKGNKISYTLFSGSRNIPSRVYVYDFKSNKKYRISDNARSAFGSSISSDETKVAFSMSKRSATEIYEFNTRSLKRRRITFFNSISTSPSYSPDASQMTFASDQSGSGEIYVLNNSGKYKRISFGKGNYSSPAWSHNGKFIAFIKLYKNKFYLGVFDVQNRYKEHLLISSNYIDSPSWSRGGTAIAYNTNTVAHGSRTGYVGIIDILSGKSELLPLPIGSSDPSWGR